MLNWFKRKKDKGKEEIDEKEDQISEEMEEAGEMVQDLKESTEEVKEKMDENLEDLKEEGEELREKTEEIEEGVESFRDEAREKLEESKEELEDLKEDLEEEIEEAEEELEKKKKLSFFDKLKEGLTKTRDGFTDKIDGILKSYKKIDEELFEDLEEVLVTADVGVSTTMILIDNLRERVREEKTTDPNEVKELLKDEIKKIMLSSQLDNKLNIEPSPSVILVVGVNGVGKTTTIGKMANNFKKDGKKVLIAAGDTFRAAAIEQLEEWGNRAGVDIISHKEGADPAAVIFDGIQAAKARGSDILICDTAGRLHNKANLMQELNKIFRIVDREYGEATKEILLVLDATTGQNAISQAKVFKEVANITGVALTKLDGTAKGGVVIALHKEMDIPVKLVGVGEGIDDLQEFVVQDFVEALFQ